MRQSIARFALALATAALAMSAYHVRVASATTARPDCTGDWAHCIEGGADPTICDIKYAICVGGK